MRLPISAKPTAHPPLIPLAVCSFALAVTFVLPFHHEQLLGLCAVYLTGFLVLLWHVFASSVASRLALTVKAFVLVIVAPPLFLMVGQLLLGTRPYLVYPNSLRLNLDYGPRIEAISYGVALAFAAAFLMGAGELRSPGGKMTIRKSAEERRGTERRAVPTVFWLLITQSIVFSSFQLFRGGLALIQGGYGLSEGSHLLGVNCWNAMGTLCLVLASGFRDRNDAISKAILWLSGLYIVTANLLTGNRADIIGLALLGIVLMAGRRLRVSRGMVVATTVTLTLALASLVASYRSGHGIRGEDAQVRTVVHYDGFWYLPSVNDFFGSLPMTISYMQYDDGELWLGKTYFICLTTLLPGAINPWRIDESATTYLINNYCQFNGGMYLPAELWINFGVVGLLLAAPIIGRSLTWAERRLTVDAASAQTAVVCAMIVGFPRWLLYGTSSFSKQLFLIGLFWIMASLIARRCGAHPKVLRQAGKHRQNEKQMTDQP